MSFATHDKEESKPPSTSSSIQIQPSQPCRCFEFNEIQIATKNFDESLVIGKGGFGKVYKADITNGSGLVVTAAIKRLDSMSQQGASEFWAEAEMLSKFRHCNIVSLIGYCNHENEMILVYEYISNGTLDDHLHKRNTPLPWLQRLNICIGAGRGLHYLHTGTGMQFGIIHRDVKSSNILLDENYGAKISDFGLSKTCPTNQPSTHVNTHIKGTYGYVDPNYYQTGMLTRKSDVYAFGVVLLEVLCRTRVLDRRLYGEDRNLATWAQDSIKEGNVKYIIDSHIKGEISPKCLKEFIRIVETCLHNLPKHRLSMAEVVVGLERVLVLQEKFNNSLQSRGTTLYGRMVNLFPFPSKGENSGDLKLSNNSKGSNTFPELEGVPAHFQGLSPSLKVFKFADLKKATRKFSPDLLLARAASGKVFLGWVDHQNTIAPSIPGFGIAVAVKRFNDDSYVKWLTQVTFLGHLAHPNIIRLLGYCRDESEHLTVYEYMANKSFHHFLHTEKVAEPLSWGTRLLILIGAVRGLTFLHSENLIFRDFKSTKILLDEDFNAKLEGCGDVKYGPESGETHVTTLVQGTLGYLAPEYFHTGHLTTKCDIYSLGVVLLESITGRRPYERSELGESGREFLLVKWASSIASDGRNVKEIMDPRLKDNYSLQGASECFSLALRCIAEKSKDRPSSEEVLQSLEQIYALYK
ncbi:hypothetical protein SSX86_030982 [Deinandra increscens subsp. villosa]|uniref:Protein kinase domain-containing protein n=1 Tax=Deinandra increscens subsp. villosa TaxID=3103831 RepID=A0AAP0CAH5_9ASTR